jgi:hypothetical protein
MDCRNAECRYPECHGVVINVDAFNVIVVIIVSCLHHLSSNKLGNLVRTLEISDTRIFKKQLSVLMFQTIYNSTYKLCRLPRGNILTCISCVC